MVYVVIERVQHEGSEVISVHRTREGAVAAREDYVASRKADYFEYDIEEFELER